MLVSCDLITLNPLLVEICDPRQSFLDPLLRIKEYEDKYINYLFIKGSISRKCQSHSRTKCSQQMHLLCGCHLILPSVCDYSSTDFSIPRTQINNRKGGCSIFCDFIYFNYCY